MGPPMHMQFWPAGLPQQPPQFMQQAPQQFRPVGQAMPGVSMGMPGQMPHFPQPGQHTPHSGHVPPASQAVPTEYHADRPMPSAPMQPPPQAVFPGGHMPNMGAPYTNQPTSVPTVAQPWGTAPGQGAPLVSLMVQPGHQFLSASLPPVSSTEPSSSDWQEHSSGNGKYYYNKRTTQSSWEKSAALMTPLEEKEKAAEQRKRHIAEYRAFLESCDFIKADTQWRKVRDWLEDYECCFRLGTIDRLNVFEEYTWDLEKEEAKQRKIQKEQTRIQERKNRGEFRRMLEEHVGDGTLHAKTHWRDYCAQVRDSHAYLAVVSNTSGSLPRVLFEDVMEELDKQYQDDKTLVEDKLKSGKIHMTASWTLQDFQAMVIEDNKCKGISNINIKLIYEDQIERLKKKELKKAKNDNFRDLLCSIKEITATSTWDYSTALFDDSQEYRDLGVKAYASELSDKYIVCLKERYKEKKRTRKEEEARKEKDHEEGEKEKDKEKERKDKDCREKERDREKEREKEKGKDQSKRDEIEVSGDDVEIHGSKDKKREKDKEKKHKRHHHDTTDDLDEKDDSKKSRRHNSDRKHTHALDWIRKTGIEDIEGTETSSRKNGLNEELEDGELREDGEIQ